MGEPRPCRHAAKGSVERPLTIASIVPMMIITTTMVIQKESVRGEGDHRGAAGIRPRLEGRHDGMEG